MNSSLELSFHDEDILKKEETILNLTDEIHKELQKKIIKNNSDTTDNQNIFTDSYHQEVEDFYANFDNQSQCEIADIPQEMEPHHIEMFKKEFQSLLDMNYSSFMQETEEEKRQIDAELVKKAKINKLMQAEQMADRYKNNRLKNKGYLFAKNQIVSAKVPHNRIQTQIKTQTKVVSNNLNKVTAESFKAPGVSNHKKQHLLGGRLTFDYRNQINHNNPVTPLQNNNSFVKTTVTSVLGNHLRNHTSTTYLNRNNNLNAKNVSDMKKNPKNPKLDDNYLLKACNQITVAKGSYKKYF